MPSPLSIGPLSPPDVDGVRALAAASAAADGVEPLSEQPLLRLGVDEGWLTHAVARSKAGQVVGYVQVDRGGEDASAELVVHPEHRRGGVGRLLLRTAERDATLPQFGGTAGHHGKRLRVWAHGNLGPARAFAARAGYVVVRELLFLARPLPGAAEPAGAAVPPGYRVRTFEPGRDDDAWVALNARAFAAHPEQGRLTVADLHDRMAEPWFDAAGFFLVEDADGGLAASLWTKVEGGDGEIYAVGVDPDHQGRGLGRALTSTALEHLAGRATRATLYVDGDNSAALAVYDRAGFARAAVDVQYGPSNGAII
ncbi:mycothiol synthase [Xylanimonas protaetiae]|uniref:Mycothiol acetyltransferase n=1 Tax=Xylanimonas protaetiae TaxID=2509457 RepID=A0A4P6F2N3_9MICO|nr:mycothiol synthase [Xylanimonas protaetiae]QAY69822.1 mycothiol synthase [Xylanimonas protaetiae]